MTDTATQIPAACQFCGVPLKSLANAIGARCMVCGERGRTRTWCTAGHFVCEECRGREMMQLVEGMLALPRSTDPVEAFLQMRRSHPFPMHGPEHHPLAAAAFLLVYHDLHGEPSWAAILDALETAATQLPGGSCGYWGACSAGLAVGMAYCAILNSSPTDGHPRALSHRAVAGILARLAEFDGPRCCRRESLLSLQIGCELSRELLPHPLSTKYTGTCEQASDNPECIGGLCPLA